MRQALWLLFWTFVVEFIIAPIGARVFDHYVSETAGVRDMIPDIPLYEWGYATVFALGAAAGIALYRWRTNRTPPSSETERLKQQRLMLKEARASQATAADAFLSLSFFSTRQPPRPLQERNIARHFLMETSYDVLAKDGQRKGTFLHSILFLVFDTALSPRRLSLTSEGFEMPSYEVKMFSERAAVIVVDGHLPAGILNVHVLGKEPSPA